MRVLVACCALLLAGCLPDVCTPNTTRCTETNVAEICSARGDEWFALMDCGDVGEPGWACCRTGSGCTCLPAGDCPVPAAEVTP